MEPLPIVKKRVRLWPILLTIIVIALLVAAVFYVMGDRGVTDVSGLLSNAGPGFTRVLVPLAA
jgi:hypothetical protein